MFLLKLRQQFLSRNLYNACFEKRLYFSSMSTKHHYIRFTAARCYFPVLKSEVKCLNLKNGDFKISCSFHTSKPRYFHPALWIVLRPVLKFAAVLTGRGVKKWWRNLPKDKKKHFYEQFKANRRKIAICLSLAILSGVGYYAAHLEETPVTKRRRFMAFNPKQLEEINEFELEAVLKELGPQVLPQDHKITQQVCAIVKRIVDANKDIKEFEGKKFGVSVVDSPVENAFVLPIGHVFVFVGMIRLCANIDQLGSILSHEIAHSILNHGAENVSHAHILDLISIAIIATIWAIIPSDYISLLIHWLYQQSIKIFMELPYNRKLEIEADEVGLQLAAKACFDVRESSAFWSEMAILNKNSDSDIKFLSTHPSHEQRADHLDDLMDDALKLRSSCKCPVLKPADPRLHIETLTKALEVSRKKLLEPNLKKL